MATPQRTPNKADIKTMASMMGALSIDKLKDQSQGMSPHRRTAAKAKLRGLERQVQPGEKLLKMYTTRSSESTYHPFFSNPECCCPKTLRSRYLEDVFGESPICVTDSDFLGAYIKPWAESVERYKEELEQM